MRSYLGDDLNLAFTWLVTPVVGVVIYVETALIQSLLVLGCLVTKFLYFQLYLGWRVCCVFVTTSFEVVVPGQWFPRCTVMWFACVMVNSMFLYPAGMMN